MASDATTDHDFDGFWKELLDEFLPEFLAFFVPDLLGVIDLSQPIVSLEKELHELFPEDRSGRGFVDKLFKVGLRDGGSARLLLHIDAQGDPEASFPERMFRYRYRLIDKYHLPIYSIAVLADRDPNCSGFGRSSCSTSRTASPSSNAARIPSRSWLSLTCERRRPAPTVGG